MSEQLEKTLPSEEEMDEAINQSGWRIEKSDDSEVGLDWEHRDPEDSNTGRFFAEIGDPRPESTDPESITVVRKGFPSNETNASVVRKRPGTEVWVEAEHYRPRPLVSGEYSDESGRVEIVKTKTLPDGSTKELVRVSEHPAAARAAIKFAADRLEPSAPEIRRAA